MNKSLPVILFIAVIGLTAGLAYEWQQVNHYKALVAQLEKDANGAREESEKNEAELRKQKEQIVTYKATTEQLETRNKELAANGPARVADPAIPAGAPAEKGEKGGWGGMMKKMFTDPEMKKVMRSQQSMAMQMMYGDLGKELGLSPEDAKQVMEILADRQMAMAAEGMKFMEGGDKEGKEMEEAGKKLNESREGFDKQIEGILGKDGLAKFNDYERTIGDRTQLNQYKQAMTAGGVPIDDKQAQGLLGIMKEERLKQPPSPFDPGAKDTAAAMKAMRDEDQFNQLMSSQEDLNRRVLTRARTILSPDQMVQFEQAQTSQMEMQKMGMKMGREMMKGK